MKKKINKYKLNFDIKYYRDSSDIIKHAQSILDIVKGEKCIKPQFKQQICDILNDTLYELLISISFIDDDTGEFQVHDSAIQYKKFEAVLDLYDDQLELETRDKLLNLFYAVIKFITIM